MIWKFCIPRRVVELEVPVKDVLPRTNCDFIWTNRHMSSPPLITRICRESRKVALENGGPLQDYPEVVQTEFNWKAIDAWFSPKYDIVAWYWRPEQQVAYGLEVVGDPLSYFVQNALQAQGALILSRNIYPFVPFDSNMNSPPIMEEDELAKMTRLKTIMVCVKTLGIHASPEEAKGSNLWGLTGEEMIRMVDATDVDTIREFTNHLSTEGAEAKRFRDLTTDHKYSEQLARWKRELTTWWIWQHWLAAYHRAFRGVPAPKSIWIDKLAKGDEFAFDMMDPTTFWAPETYPHLFDMNSFVENQNHPWVAHILGTMPDFRPVAMFRLCALDCHKTGRVRRSDVIRFSGTGFRRDGA